NSCKMSTQHSKTPESLYALSRAKAINRGYWRGDPGDDIETASGLNYGRDSESEPGPPMDELHHDDPITPIRADYTSVEEERQDGVFVNDDNEIATGRELLEGVDVTQNDDNWGIDIYCQAV
ncbi:hypothetical protein C8J56DRAFT_710800, partial [Mycena floridula]